jgi:metallophosphoesterase (TIGR00282 family)
MRILFCGDVVGRSGRDVIVKNVPHLRSELNLDCVIVNGENAAHGFGINGGICREFYGVGVDIITTGNHVWDQREVIGYIDQDKRLLRPLNSLPGTPGQGYVVHTTIRGQTVLVINVMGKLFMDPLEDPFSAVDSLLKKYPLGIAVSAIVVDIHAEATSEKMAMAHYCDGRASFVVGTHTHVPTADAMILDGGTAYQTDAGMCGDYNSVVGMAKEIPIFKFTRKMPPPERMAPAQGEATLCGVYVETDDKTGKAILIKPLRIGGKLSEALIS